MRSSFVEHELPNGLRVVCELMPQVRSVAAGFCARTGARHELPDQQGISHFLEHMCFKGTARRDSRAINVRFDELGSIYNAYTGKEHTLYYGWLPAGRLAAQLELLADMMRPALPAADLATERQVVLEEIAMSADSFEQQVADFLHQVAFGPHPLGHEILGQRQTVARLSRRELAAYHRQRYSPDNMYLVVTGALEAEEVFAAAGRYCGAWEPARDRARCDPPPPLPGGVYKRRLPQFRQQSLVLLFPSVPSGHPQAETVQAFAALFGGSNSRCYWNIVQKGICAQAGALWLGYRDCGLLALYADGQPQRCPEMVAALRAEARRVSRHGFSREEVRRIRNKRRTQLALEAENPRSRLMQLVEDLETHGQARTVEARLAAAEAVSVKSIADYLERFPIVGEGLLLSAGPRDWP